MVKFLEFHLQQRPQKILCDQADYSLSICLCATGTHYVVKKGNVDLNHFLRSPTYFVNFCEIFSRNDHLRFSKKVFCKKIKVWYLAEMFSWTGVKKNSIFYITFYYLFSSRIIDVFEKYRKFKAQ